MLSGCSARQEKIERTETNQLEQSKIEKKVSESNEEEILDLSDDFNGVNGCAVLYSPSKNKYSFYNKDMAEQQVSPYSTFKIISTLIGLHNNIIKDETSTLNYNGTQYPNSEWNENLTLQKAFHMICMHSFVFQCLDFIKKHEWIYNNTWSNHTCCFLKNTTRQKM